jgi:hypothetical protein
MRMSLPPALITYALSTHARSIGRETVALPDNFALETTL